MTFNDINLTSADLSKLSQLVIDGQINDSFATSILVKSLYENKSPLSYLEESTSNVLDEQSVAEIVEIIFTNNADAVSDSLSDPNAINFLFGQVMKESNGKAPHRTVRSVVDKKLSNLKGN